MRRRPSISPARAGFTLVELLVSMAVLSLLAISLFRILASTSDAWARSEGQSDSYREARAALDLIASDLRTLVRSSNFDHWFFKSDGVADGQTINGYNASASAGGTVFFFTLASKSAQDPAKAKSQFCGVAYFLSYTNDPSPNPSVARASYKLYRKLISSEDTNTMLATAGSGGNVVFKVNIDADDVLARNVINFYLTPYWLDAGTGQLTKTPPSNPPVRQAPIAVDVELTSFPSNVSETLNSREAWEDTRLANYRKQRQQRFTTRVFLSKR